MKRFLEDYDSGKEAGRYHLGTLAGERSPHIDAVKAALAEEAVVEEVAVAYRFQKGAEEMLVVRRR